MSAAPHYLVFAATRNEGAFLVEWITWYRMLGFTVMVAHNDCTDQSPALLAALAAAGWVTPLPFSAEGGNAKPQAHKLARAHPLTATADWLLICDVDEFLVLHRGDGTIASFVDDMQARTPTPPDGICFHWRCFGTQARDSWEDALQHRHFTACGAGNSSININFKTLFREPLRFRRFGDHAPDRFDGGAGIGDRHFVDSEGRSLAVFDGAQEPVRMTSPAEVTHRAAQMNHYMLRTLEDFLLKRGTPSASAGVDRYTEKFFKRRNQNSQRDLSALRYHPRFMPLWAEAMALPDVARLHHLCCADRVARIAALSGADPAQDPRWQHHMAMADMQTPAR